MRSGANLTLALILADEANAEGRRLLKEALLAADRARQEARRQRLERTQKIRSVILWGLAWGVALTGLRATFIQLVAGMVASVGAVPSIWLSLFLFDVPLAAALFIRRPHWSKQRGRELLVMLGLSFPASLLLLLVWGIVVLGIFGVTEAEASQVPQFGWAWTLLWASGGAGLRALDQVPDDASGPADWRAWTMLGLVSVGLIVLSVGAG